MSCARWRLWIVLNSQETKRRSKTASSGKGNLQASFTLFASSLLRCLILPALLSSAFGESPPVTFNKDVAPLVFRNCATCHRPGQSAPFSLLTYNDAKKRAKQIAEVTARRYMPPWLPEGPHDQFIGD